MASEGKDGGDAEVYATVGRDITGPFFHQGTLAVLSRANGDIIVVEEGKEGGSVLANTGGQPSGVAVDDDGNLFVADLAAAAILQMDSTGSESEVMVQEYESKPFVGPTDVVFDGRRNMFFTDSGPFGETTLSSPRGSLFAVVESPDGGQVLKPIALESLAHPAGLCLSPDGACIYVAEMMTNRLLRFVQQPQGVYHASVFYQFSGMIGPSSLACDSNGNIYVGRYDLSSCSSRGAVSVISATGVAVAELSVPGPEVTGVALSKDETELYVTEASSNTIYRFQGECGSFYIGGHN